MLLILEIIEFKDLIVLCKKRENKFKKEYNSSFFVGRFFLDDMRSFEVNFVDELFVCLMMNEDQISEEQAVAVDVLVVRNVWVEVAEEEEMEVHHNHRNVVEESVERYI